MLPTLLPLWNHQKVAIEKAVPQRDYALFFEMGCLASHTLVKINRGKGLREYTIEKLYRLFNGTELSPRERGFSPKLKTYCRSWKGDHIGLHEISKVVRSGEKEVYRLDLGTHLGITLTKDHEVFTKRGWVPAGKLRIGKDMVALDLLERHQKKKNPVAKKPKVRYGLIQVGGFHPYARKSKSPYSGKTIYVIEKHRAIAEATLSGLGLKEFQEITRYTARGLKFIDPKKFHVHHIDHNHKNNDPDNLEVLPAKEHLKHHCEGYKNFEHGQISWRTVRSFSYVGKEMTYDIVCKDPHRNFVANNVVVHNCGKTATAINILRWHYVKEKRLMRTLILAPIVVVENWKREFKVHSKVDQSKILTLTASGKKRVEQFRTMSDTMAEGVVVTNFEALSMKDFYNLLMQWRPEIIVIDESQRIKNPKAQRTKLAIALGDLARHRYILSGTPILNNAIDIFSQYRFLDGGETFGKNFFEFRGRYFQDKNAGMPAQRYFPDWQPRPGAYQEFNRLIYNKAMRVLKKDCLDLPPLVRKTLHVELTPQQKKNYEEMKRDFVTYLNDKACVANLALTKALRLLQISSGFFKGSEEAEAVHYEDSGRVEALRELLEVITPSAKVIVWACFRENYVVIEKLLKEMGLPYSILYGGLSQGDRTKAIDDFQTNPDVKVMVANQAAGGVGVNLTAASYMIYFSRNFSLEADMQSEARNHRGGSEIFDKITRIDLVAPGTIDEVVLEALQRKENMAENILKFKERFL